MFQTLLVNPFLQAIHGIAVLFNDNYGISIIVITLIIRLVLMPFMLKQYKNQQLLKSKIESIKPEMDKIQEKIKNSKDKEEQQKFQQEIFALYRQHGVNPLNMGCLPLLIQMPILMGLYYAIRGSHEIATHSFLWFSLGQPNLGITLIAGIVYYIQIKVTQHSLPEQQQKQMKIMGLLSPIMIIIFSINSPAALPLYWAVGGIFLVFQSFLSRKIYNPDRSMKDLGNEIG
ncbi:membrane protein insertase YidC [Schinkia azotoformans]|uniref:YidC/Oxa1 family membrane protein insertase n=1 Tax=Schinkia azotoformans LMG 9581 TaxID=1131731 RepID=K6DCR8_SCHAZ|nr:membrane protein insertase YidC [Schinkia azotoformans]EKN66079.1 YidC/Oxa1 family membrane protein insertase [Schinkia azotoformans LMG 9581]MEC1639779.1 membrane protein insertase YidC [Schinkia azotoformans]MEC1722729.1 membrane protein insertase YidC [Schinkia azotoformans]MEC1944194.1 membrane protein insertase YidC [Schinkia azotoformans]MED4354296.1 membrane protein insertase YidC [Schinkia azotoformans]